MHLERGWFDSLFYSSQINLSWGFSCQKPESIQWVDWQSRTITPAGRWGNSCKTAPRQLLIQRSVKQLRWQLVEKAGQLGKSFHRLFQARGMYSFSPYRSSVVWFYRTWTPHGWGWSQCSQDDEDGGGRPHTRPSRHEHWQPTIARLNSRFRASSLLNFVY